MPATSANLVHVDDFGSLIRKPMYCVRVQQAVVGRVVLLTFIPEKNSLLGWLSNFTGHCQWVSPTGLKWAWTWCLLIRYLHFLAMKTPKHTGLSFVAKESPIKSGVSRLWWKIVRFRARIARNSRLFGATKCCVMTWSEVFWVNRFFWPFCDGVERQHLRWIYLFSISPKFECPELVSH